MTDTNTEKLKFKLELWSTHWNKTPVAEILINDTSHYRAEITGTEDKPSVIEFKHTLEEGEGELEGGLLDKGTSDLVETLTLLFQKRYSHLAHSAVGLVGARSRTRMINNCSRLQWKSAFFSHHD